MAKNEHGLMIEGHTSNENTVAIFYDNKYKVSCSNNKSISVEHPNKDQEFALKGHKEAVNSVAITYENEFIVLGVMTKLSECGVSEKNASIRRPYLLDDYNSNYSK